MAQRVYFDHSATTPLDPRVKAAIEPFLGDVFGNPSSLHWAGREARAAVEQARGQVAELLQAVAEEICFTASGTEADNLALRGVFADLGPGRHHLIISSVEHPAVLETARWLERGGVELTLLPVDGESVVDPGELRRALRPETRLVSVMTANNVVGSLQPIAELACITKEHGALFHTDAVQAVGKIPLDVRTLPVDLLSLSAHKFHGPKGVGALWIRKNVRLMPIVFGGGQEHGLRSATENVAGIVGLGEAAAISRREMSADAARLVQLRDRFIDALPLLLPNAYLIGPRYRRLPGHICLGLAGQEPESIKLLLALDEAGFAISTGSACSAHHGNEPSYILRAMGFDPIRARGSLRITLGRGNTEAELDRFLQALPIAAAGLRSISTRQPVHT